jgi:hypothetical protein
MFNFHAILRHIRARRDFLMINDKVCYLASTYLIAQVAMSEPTYCESFGFINR